ncbi:MAG: flagellar hook-basal body complex protein FliE [Pseudomonadales bacterium]|nr:flagellar hook-basal body complex protein FliE [Pseudomonadales bacterium]
METQGINQVNQVLAQIRSIRQQSDISKAPGIAEPSALSSPEQLKNPNQVEFSTLIRDSLDSVNALQKDSMKMKEAFAKEDPNISLAQVMVSMQKADVSFKAVTEVRNKFVDAYREVMRMSV